MVASLQGSLTDVPAAQELCSEQAGSRGEPEVKWVEAVKEPVQTSSCINVCGGMLEGG